MLALTPNIPSLLKSVSGRPDPSTLLNLGKRTKPSDPDALFVSVR
jgi:hypothetical protein